jgi:ceramide glucosyltransferase
VERLIDTLSLIVLVLFVIHRLAKMLAVALFFRRPAAAPPVSWPGMTLIQPVTRSDNDLARVLHARLRLEYPGTLQHILVCDAADAETQSTCRAALAGLPGLNAELVLAGSPDGPVASKIEKMLTALPLARGDVLCFVDDDILLPPSALQTLAVSLQTPAAGAAFGLACYTNWRNLWSGLISSFVNSNAFLSYVPLTYLTEPFTITGHCFAVPRSVFTAAGGFDGLLGRVDDDHELARRIRGLGLRLVQAPLIYEVDNYISSFHGYWAQMKRWFVMPRQSMLPGMTAKESALMMLTSADQWAPPVLAALALAWHQPLGITAALGALGLVYLTDELCGRRYSHHPTPRRWLLLPGISALLAPLLIIAALMSDDLIEWRGQRLRLQRGGRMELQ